MYILRKIYLFVLLVLLLGKGIESMAQSRREGAIRQFEQRDIKTLVDDSDNDRHGAIYSYFLDRRTGALRPAFLDTLRLNYYYRSSPEGRSIAEAYTSTYASPYQSKVYFDRPIDLWGDFFMVAPYVHLLHRGRDMRFFDTKVPYTMLSYVKNGGSEQVEELFHTLFSTNLGRKINVGGQFDYDYANGYYAATKSKNVTYRLFGSYLGDRYQLFASIGNTNVIHFENGGIIDDRYITHPDDFTDGRRALSTKDIPTRYRTVWNRMIYGAGRLHHRYSLGFTTTDSIPSGDSVRVMTRFTPVTHFFHDLSAERSRRRFVGQDQELLKAQDTLLLPRDIDDPYYPNDLYSFISISNTVGIELLEGFNKWAKVGMTAFAAFDHKRYTIPLSGQPDQNLNRIENTTYIGGRISSQKMKLLRYSATGEIALAGANAGEINIEAYVDADIQIKKTDLRISLTGSFRNTPPNYMLQRYKGTFREWDQSLAMFQTLQLGGMLALPAWGTRLTADIQTIQNPMYVAPDGTPRQKSTNLRVMAVGGQQNLRLGALNWQNSIVWQVSSDQEVAPLPMLAAYSNLFLKFLVAKVMTLQIGVDAKWHTAYHVPYYDPVTQLFRPQEEVQIGGTAPFMTGYANVHLKRTRFFVQYYNLSSLLFRPRSHFSMPHYPLYPALVRLGLVVDLRN